MSENVEQYKPGAVGELRTGIISRNTLPDKPVQYAAIDGLAIFEGDIILGTVEEMDELVRRIRPLGLVIKDNFRWPGGVIPFQIDSALRNQARVTQAIQHWENNTDIRFRARTANDDDFVTFQPGTGCSSSVGRRGGEQFINLDAGCTTGNTIHFTNATIYVRLEDTTFANAPSVVVLQQTIEEIPKQAIQEGKVPFALYGEIANARATYTISVLVDVDGDGKVTRGDYINMESYPVLTFGYPSHVTVRVRKVT